MKPKEQILRLLPDRSASLREGRVLGVFFPLMTNSSQQSRETEFQNRVKKHLHRDAAYQGIWHMTYKMSPGNNLRPWQTNDY